MMRDVRADILDWVRHVANLAAEVSQSLGKAEGFESALVGVKLWSDGMANRLGEHMERCNGQKVSLVLFLSEFYKESSPRRREKIHVDFVIDGCPERLEERSPV